MTFKRLVFAVSLFLCENSYALAQNAQPVISDRSVPTGYIQVTSTASAIGFTPPTGTTFCNVVPEAQAVRYRTDGINPTATVGMPLAVGTPASFRMSIANLTSIRFIAQSAGAILNIECYKDA